MKKFIFLIVSFFFWCVHCSAQSYTDSLIQKIKNSKQDSSLVKNLFYLAWAKVYNKPDTSITLAQQGILLSQKLNIKKGEILSLSALNEAYNETGNYPGSLEIALQQLRLSEEINDTLWICASLTAVAIGYQYEQNYSLALRYYYRANAIATANNDKVSLIATSNSLSELFEDLNQLDSAMAYANECLQLSIAVKNIDFKGCSFTNLGTINMKMNQPSVAMDYYRTAIPYFKQTDDNEYLCRCYVEMATFFQQSKQMDSALYYGNLCVEIARDSHLAEWTIKGSDFLTGYYKATHNIDSAFAYQSVSIAAKDSLFNQRKAQQVQSLSFNEAMHEQQVQMAKEEANNRRIHNIQYAIIAILLIALSILFLMLSRSVIVNEKWIRFLTVLVLLLLFEFINLYIHPALSQVTHDSPFLMLAVMVMIAAILIPLHHNVQHYITDKLVKKNKQIRLAHAKRTIAKLETNGNKDASDEST